MSFRMRHRLAHGDCRKSPLNEFWTLFMGPLPLLTLRSSIVDHSTRPFFVHSTSNSSIDTFSTVLRLFCVAFMVLFVYPVCRGMLIRNGVESLSGMPWNVHPECCGITHRIGVEYTGSRCMPNLSSISMPIELNEYDVQK
jgi:hypothetical protein